MTNSDKIRAIIRKREAMSDEWPAGLEECWNELVDALTEDIDTTRRYLLDECTADEASWVSEVYDEIVYKTQSREYINLLRQSIKRFPEESAKLHMAENLDIAVRSMLIE